MGWSEGGCVGRWFDKKVDYGHGDNDDVVDEDVTLSPLKRR